jgi:hypothetical protein
MRTQLNQRLAQAAATAQQLAISFTALAGGSVQQQIAAASRALSNPNLALDPNAQMAAGQQVLQLQQQGLQELITTAPDAETALAQAEGGIATDPRARQAIIDSQKRLYGRVLFPPPTEIRATEQELRQLRQQVLQESIVELQAREGAYLSPVEQASQAVRIARMQYQGAQNDTERAQAQIAINQGMRQLREAQDAVVRSGLELMQAMTEDPVEDANIGVRIAEFDVQAALKSNDPAKVNQARGALVEARRQRRDALLDIARSQVELMAAAAGDPVSEANAAIQSAQFDLQAAGSDRAAANRARASIIQAQRQRQEALDDIDTARGEVLTAATGNQNAVAAAQAQQANANRQARRARGEAERLRALAAQIQANRALQEALDAIFDSQIQLAQAMADAAGQVIRSAGLGLQLAEAALARAGARGAGEAEMNTLRADVVRARAAVDDAKLSNRRDIIEFNLEMEKITTDQAIAQLQALMSIADPAEQRDLLRRIKALRDQASQDLQFNIPDEIRLPTLYEVRRLNQTPAGSSYQDNRVVSVNIAAINNQADMAAALNAIRDAAGGSPAPRTGVRPGLY